MKALFTSRRLLPALTMACALAAPTLAGAQARCFQWDVTQPWVALQDNGYRVELHLTRQASDLAGTSTSTSPKPTSGPFSAVVSDRVTGTLQGDAIEFHSLGGAYVGSIEASGRIVGTTHDEANPTARSRARFVSDRNMKCQAFRARPAGSDFSGDGRNDILWHNAATGESQVWFMNGASRVGRGTINDGVRPIFIGPPWRIVGNRDFDGNRQSDLVWYNSSTGETQLWFMEDHQRLKKRATVVAENGRALFVGPPWSIVGTNDMDNSGTSDIVWHNSSTGEIQVWLMKEGNKIDRRPMVLAENGTRLSISAPRRIVGVSDMNDDGNPDLILHNGVTGTTQVFFMNGLKVASRPRVVAENGSEILVGPPWRIAATNDFDQRGGADIVWHNAATGETQIWFMQGPRILSRGTVNANQDGGGAMVGLPWSIMNQ